MIRIGHFTVLLTGIAIVLTADPCAGQSWRNGISPASVRGLKAFSIPFLKFSKSKATHSADDSEGTAVQQAAYQGAEAKTYATPLSMMPPEEIFNGLGDVDYDATYDNTTHDRSFNQQYSRGGYSSQPFVQNDTSQNYHFSDGRTRGYRGDGDSPNAPMENARSMTSEMEATAHRQSFSSVEQIYVEDNFEAPTPPVYVADPSSHRPTAPVSPVGAEFRGPNRTASELLIHFKDQNFALREDIRRLNENIKTLGQTLETEKTDHAATQVNLATARREIVEMREMIAKLNVNVQTLQQEKMAIQQDADRALRDIEANLEAALMASLSSAMDRETDGDRVPILNGSSP